MAAPDLAPNPEAPGWLDELAFEPGPPWLAMGVRTLDWDRWLVVDDRAPVELALKERLLAERGAQVFEARPGSEAAGVEALALVRDWLGRHRPAHLARFDEPGSGRHPLDQAGRLVQEDLCLLADDGQAHRLVAASLCFPSHWRLGEKLGRTVAEIHGPVPHYATELESKVDTFFRRLRPERPVVRRNLSIHSHDDLFRPEPHESPDSFARDPSGVDGVWLRSERQTLARLPETGAVLFTIKTQQCPASVLSHRPDIAQALAAKLAALEPELARTGNTIPFPAWLIGWLETR